jgi:hypothetical protein
MQQRVNIKAARPATGRWLVVQTVQPTLARCHFPCPSVAIVVPTPVKRTTNGRANWPLKHMQPFQAGPTCIVVNACTVVRVDQGSISVCLSLTAQSVMIRATTT